MQREKFPEMRQFFGFLYLGDDGKFRARYPVDIIEGAMLEHLSSGKLPTLPDLVSPYNSHKVLSILKKAKKFGMLDYRIDNINIRPGRTEMPYTIEVSATIPSRSGRYPESKPRVRDAFDMYKFETLCTCDSFGEARWICGVWSPIILKEWGLPIIDNNKYYTEHVDAHLEALRFRVLRDYGSDIFGFNFEDFMKPYVLAYLDVLEKYPRATNYMMDIGFTYFSPLFNPLKKELNKKRHSAWPPLDDLEMYDDYYVKEYLLGKIDEDLERSRLKYQPKSMSEIIETIGFEEW